MKNRLLVGVAAGTLALAVVACGGDADTPSGAGSTSVPPTTAAAAGKALALDTTYGTAGIAKLPLNAATNDRFMATAVAPDGKVYGAGFVTSGGDQAMAVARMDATGKLDTTFGTGGIASANVATGGGTAELARAIVIQSSGKIVISGPAEHDPTAAGDAARDTDYAAVRFDTTGKLDTTFGEGGIARIDITPGRIISGTSVTGDSPWGLGNLSGDKVVLWGTALPEDASRTDTDYVMVGLTAAGALDTSFGSGGKLWVDLENESGSPRNVIVQADGKIVASGYASIKGVVQPVLVRMSAAGVLDTAFGKGGVATTKVLDGVTEAYSVSLQGNNYVLAGYGRGADASEKVDIVVYRFTPNGTLDTTFGTSGVTRIDVAKEDDRARNVIVLPDNRILAVGSGKKDAANINAMMVLLEQNGAVVTNFGESGHLISDLGGPSDAWYGVALSADKKFVYVAGYKGVDANSGGNDDAALARIAL